MFQKIKSIISPEEFILNEKITDIDKIFDIMGHRIYRMQLSKDEFNIYFNNLINKKKWESEEDFKTLNKVFECRLVDYNKIKDNLNNDIIEKYKKDFPSHLLTKEMVRIETIELGKIINNLPQKEILNRLLDNREVRITHTGKNLKTKTYNRRIYLNKLYINDKIFSKIDVFLKYKIIKKEITFQHKDKIEKQKIIFNEEFFYFIKDLDKLIAKSKVF